MSGGGIGFMEDGINRWACGLLKEWVLPLTRRVQILPISITPLCYLQFEHEGPQLALTDSLPKAFGVRHIIPLEVPRVSIE